MALFRRKRRDDTGTTPEAASPQPAQDASDQALTGADRTDAVDATGGEGGEQRGPYDSAALPSKDGYVDLGAVWLPAIQGLMLTMEVDDATGDITAVRVHLGDSLLQLQAFAAPRSAGIWEEIREEIAETLPAQGGSCEVVEGPFGAELLARVPGRGADNRTTTSAMRFVGIDGPRWFLRGVISGPAALDEELRRSFTDLLSISAVYRDGQPRGPRELLPLQFPPEADAAEQPAQPGEPEAGTTSAPENGSTVESAAPHEQDRARSADDLRPFERGPEITEIR